MDRYDFFWRMCEQNLIYCRHHEDQRVAVSRLILFSAAGALGLVKLFEGSDIMQLALAVFVFALGLFGVYVCEKEYERFDHHYQRFRRFRDKLIEILPDLNDEDFRIPKNVADQESSSRYPAYLLKPEGGRKYWKILHLFVSLIGILLALSVFLL